MKKLLAILLSLLLLLTACTPRPQPITPPEPQPPVTEVTPDPEPDPEPEPLGYTVGETTKNAQYDGLHVNITLPVLTGENQAALDVINHYYELLAGKVLDYAEGDLVAAPGVSYEVHAGYQLTHASENTVSLLWQVTTVTTAESPAELTQSAAVFDVKTGNLCTFSDIFGENAADARAWFVEHLRSTIPEMAENSYFYDQWYDLVETSFDPDSVHFDAAGVNVFYTQDALGSAVIAAMPYDAAAQFLAIAP